MSRSPVPLQPEKRLCAACGLFCAACAYYMATQNDPDWLSALAAKFNRPPQDMQCDGCRSERRGLYCRQCKMTQCTQEKGIDFCSQCDRYPCDELKTFQAAMPHRLELWENLARITEAGYETWYREKMLHYRCPECGNLNPPYALGCRQCGNDPGSEFVRRHREDIERYLNEKV